METKEIVWHDFPDKLPTESGQYLIHAWNGEITTAYWVFGPDKKDYYEGSGHWDNIHPASVIKWAKTKLETIPHDVMIYRLRLMQNMAYKQEVKALGLGLWGL